MKMRELYRLNKRIKGAKYKYYGIFVGPEGGFEEEEIENIQEISGKLVSLGPRILKN